MTNINFTMCPSVSVSSCNRSTRPASQMKRRHMHFSRSSIWVRPRLRDRGSDVAWVGPAEQLATSLKASGRRFRLVVVVAIPAVVSVLWSLDKKYFPSQTRSSMTANVCRIDAENKTRGSRASGCALMSEMRKSSGKYLIITQAHFHRVLNVFPR